MKQICKELIDFLLYCKEIYTLCKAEGVDIVTRALKDLYQKISIVSNFSGLKNIKQIL